jgi:hypothetical protein
VLAAIYTKHADELRADFQQYYGLNIDCMGYKYSLTHAAVLVEQLPSNSRVYCAIDPGAAWGWQEHLQALQLNALNWLVWSKTKDAEKKRNKPKPVQAPSKKHKRLAVGDSVVLPLDDYCKKLSKPRREVIKDG